MARATPLHREGRGFKSLLDDHNAGESASVLTGLISQNRWERNPVPQPISRCSSTDRATAFEAVG